MKSVTTNFFFILLMSVFIISCKDDDDEVVPETPTQAIILANSTAAPLDTIYLNGSSSTNASSFEWSGNSPIGGSVTFYSSNGSQTNSASKVYFIAENTGVYSISLRVTKDGKFSNASKSISISGALQIGGTLTSNLELSNLNVVNTDSCDYFLTQDLIIPAGLRLVIKDGVKICVAEGVAIISEGTLNVEGSVGVKIEALGNNWKGIHLKSGSSDIKGLTLEDAGSASFTNNPEDKAGLLVEINNLQSLSNSFFNDNDGYGVVMRESVNCSNYFATFSNNTSGPAILSLEVFRNNQGRTQLGTSMPNTFLGITGGSTSGSSNGMFMEDLDVPYLLFGDIALGGTLTIQAGTEIYVKDTVGLIVNGHLSSEGTSSDQIIIEGLTQNSGSWKGVRAHTASLKYTTMKYAGYEALTSTQSQTFTYKCALMINLSSGFILENSTISNNDGYGLALYNVSNNPNTYKYDNNTISNNSTGALLLNASNVATVSDKVSTYLGYGSKPIITIHNESDFKIAINSRQATWSKLSAALSSTDYKFLDGNYSVTQSGVWTIEKGVYIECDANVKIEISSGSTIDAQGTNTEKVAFRGSNSVAGFWGGLYANSNAILKLDYTTIDFGGSGSGSYQGCLSVSNTVNTTSSSVTNCSFLNGGVFDLFFVGGIDAIGIKDIANNNIFGTSN